MIRMEDIKETHKALQDAVGGIQGRGVILEPTLFWVEAKMSSGVTTTDLAELME